MKLIFTMALLLALAVSASAQTKDWSAFGKHFKQSSAVYWTGVVVDDLGTKYSIDTGRFKERNRFLLSDGKYSRKKSYGYSAIGFGVTLLIDKYGVPLLLDKKDSTKVASLIRYIVGSVKIGAGTTNYIRSH